MDSFEQQAEQKRRTRSHEVDEAELTESDPVLHLASTVGNQAFGSVAREGAGILPDGRAHPDVEASIARSRGSGAMLDHATRDRVGGALGDPLNDVRIHADETSDALARSVSARAFTTGSDVYFARGEYNPGTRDGDRLLSHELSHVVQQRGAPANGPLTVSQPGDPLETEAEETTDDLVD